jgi:hypothetical protein
MADLRPRSARSHRRPRAAAGGARLARSPIQTGAHRSAAGQRDFTACGRHPTRAHDCGKHMDRQRKRPLTATSGVVSAPVHAGRATQLSAYCPRCHKRGRSARRARVWAWVLALWIAGLLPCAALVCATAPWLALPVLGGLCLALGPLNALANEPDRCMFCGLALRRHTWARLRRSSSAGARAERVVIPLRPGQRRSARGPRPGRPSRTSN